MDSNIFEGAFKRIAVDKMEKSRLDRDYPMVTSKKPKTEKGQKAKTGGGGVYRIPRKKYNPRKHDLAETSKGSHPRNEKEARLAALSHPKDKITHKDVLVGRGVIPEDESPIAMKSGDSPKEKKLKAAHNDSARELKKLKESINMISENNLDPVKLKESIHSVISSKVVRRLDEIKESIAKNYFCESSYSNITKE